MNGELRNTLLAMLADALSAPVPRLTPQSAMACGWTTKAPGDAGWEGSPLGA